MLKTDRADRSLPQPPISLAQKSSPQSQHRKADVMSVPNQLQFVGDFRMVSLESDDLIVGRHARAENEPGDRSV